MKLDDVMELLDEERMKFEEVMEMLDVSIQYYRDVAEEYMQACLREQRRGRDGDFFYQCYMVNSGRADGLTEFRAKVTDMLEDANEA